MKRLAALAAGLLLLCAGCASWPAYGRSRAADAADVVPISIAWGWGISASIQATPLFHLGLGITPVVTDRFGYSDRTFHGLWHEYQAAFPWTIWLTDLDSVPERPHGANEDRPMGDGVPLMYRWQVMKDAPSGEGYDNSHWQPVLRVWGRHHPVGRETGGAFVIPEYRRALNWNDLRLEQGDDEPLHKLGTPARATYWEVARDGPDLPRAWDLFEADLFLGILGVRVGLRPLEFLDFVAGIFGLDPAGDDLSATTFGEPRPAPPLPGSATPPAPPAAPPTEPPAADATPDPSPPPSGDPEPEPSPPADPLVDPAPPAEDPPADV